MDSYTFEKLLQHGIDENRIKEKNLSEVDLSHKDLIGIDLRGFTITKANLEYVVLTGANLRGMTFASTNCVYACFVGADLRGANLAFGYFHNADFRGADLRGAGIANALCNESNFSGADLRGAILGTEHYDSDFMGADLRGVVIPEDCDFEKLNCDISGAILTQKKSSAKKNTRDLKRVQIFPRLKVYDQKTSELAGTLLDITTQGVKLSSDHPYTVGTVFNFQILLPLRNTSIDFDAKCMWCNPAGNTNLFYSGYQIQGISDKTTEMIENLIKSSNEQKGIEISDEQELR